MPVPIANDFGAIWIMLLRNRYQREGCAPRWGRPIETCWCRYSGWSCPPPAPPEAPAAAPPSSGDSPQDANYA